MPSDAADLVTTTLLVRLLARLERDEVVPLNFVDELLNDVTGRVEDVASPSSEEASEMVHQIWGDLQRERNNHASSDHERVAWYRQQREKALRAVERVDEGGVQHMDLDGPQARDVTTEWRATKQAQAEMFGRLIDAWERSRDRT